MQCKCCNANDLQGNAIAGFSREKLEKLFADSVRKLRAKEKELAGVASERDALAQQLSDSQDSALKTGELQTRLQARPAARSDHEPGDCTAVLGSEYGCRAGGGGSCGKRADTARGRSGGAG